MAADRTFINVDCVQGAQRRLSAGSVDLIITDPPYGIQGDRLHRHYNRDERFIAGEYIEVEAGEYAAFSQAWITQAARILRPGGQIFIVSGYTNLYDVLHALRSTELVEVNHIIWKYNFGVYTSTKFVSSHYHILYYAKPGGKRTFNLQSRFALDEEAADGGSLNYRDREDVWAINREYKPGKLKNKNELPLELLKKIVAYASNEGDLVADLFMGGGSTAVAALGMNRRFIGFEKSAATFRSRVPALRALRAGGLLEEAPRPHVVPNRGKSWSAAESQRLRSRYGALRSEGVAKGDIVRVLSREFARGAWAIRKRLASEDIR